MSDQLGDQIRNLTYKTLICFPKFFDLSSDQLGYRGIWDPIGVERIDNYGCRFEKC